MTRETKYPEAARKLQEAIFNGLPEAERADWQAAFAEKAETVTDWQMVIDKTMLASLRIAEPHDTSGKFVATVIGLYERKLAGENPIDAEWYDARADARAAADAWGAAWAARAAADTAGAAVREARDAAWDAAWAAARDAAWAAARAAAGGALPEVGHAAAAAAWVQIRDEFLNA